MKMNVCNEQTNQQTDFAEQWITKQAAIDALDGVKVDEEDCTEYDIGYNDGIDFAVSKLSVLPSAQPQRIKGRWIHDGCDIPHGVDWMHCSVCGRREPHVPAAMTNFCPSCGSDMRGEGDE